MSKEALLRLLRAEREPVMALLNSLTPEEMRWAPDGRWSVEDVLRHLMDFEEDVLLGVEELEAGKELSWTGVKDWNAYNAQRAGLWAEKPLPDVRAAFVAHREQVERRLEGLTEDQAADSRFTRGFRALAVHDFKHLPGLQERQALVGGQVREATVRWVQIARHELLALLRTVPLDAYDERLPEKWSFKEILLHLANRDRMWAEIVTRVSAGGSDEWPHTLDELDDWNRREVAKVAHWPAAQVLHELGEARGAWNQAMLGAPEWLVSDPRYREWAGRRLRHDRAHLPQLAERFANWRKRSPR